MISGLKNGSTYSFTISAKNEVGLGVAATTNGVIPQPLWKKKVVDANADGKYFATGTFAGKEVIAYADSQKGLLKLATWDGKRWNKQVVDGDSSIGGRTQNSVASALSMCTYKVKKREFLNIYYILVLFLYHLRSPWTAAVLTNPSLLRYLVRFGNYKCNLEIYF